MTQQRPVRWIWLLVGVVAVSITLTLLPGRRRIAPLIESDYCYLLTAADRVCQGLGLTAPLPVAPKQPWTWEADYTFLTRWPIGYPLLIGLVRRSFSLGTIEACRWISLVVCSMALVGWFTWIRRCVPHGVTGIMLAAVAAGCSVSAATFVNPSTDALLVAAIPYVLLLTLEAVASSTTSARTVRIPLRFALAGLAAGGLFWIRYAGLFVPVAIGLFFVLERRNRRHVTRLASLDVGWRNGGAFAAGAALPILILLLINHAHAVDLSLQNQLNLGHTLRFDLSPGLLQTAWWRLTDLGFYNYYRFTHWVYALWPVVLAFAILWIAPVRRALRSFLMAPGMLLSVLVVLMLLSMLIGATAVFGDKFHYVDLDRYYLPGKPLYLLIVVGPLLLIRRRMVRVFLCLALLIASSWTLQQAWARPCQRWASNRREVTPYGQWAHCFVPGAALLYRWLSEQRSKELIVVSNFHEYIALETGMSTLPIPPNADTLNQWVERIRTARGVTKPHVLFVLDPDNRWRDYWIPQPTTIVQTFHLTRRVEMPKGVSALVFHYRELTPSDYAKAFTKPASSAPSDVCNVGRSLAP